MNLNIYEKIDIDKTKTWVNCTYKNLYSKEIRRYSMFTILKRYNPKEKCVDYFLVVSDNGDSEHKWDCITFTKSGILKINLFNYWHLLPFANKQGEFNVIIDKVEEDEDGAIYYLDI